MRFCGYESAVITIAVTLALIALAEGNGLAAGGFALAAVGWTVAKRRSPGACAVEPPPPPG